jgi:hypothetical protein
MRSNFVILVSILCAAPAFADDDRMARVRQLYEGASYAEALTALGDGPAGVHADVADEYRASCLLALGRVDEAERVLEGAVSRRPDFAFEGGDRPPKLIALLRAVQKRTGPAALKTRYAAARAEFEAGRLDLAAGQFRELLATLGRLDGVIDRETAADLRTLAEGFVRLATPAPPEPILAAVAAPAPLPPPRDAYDDRDADVTPPVAVDQRFPAWNAPRPLQRQTLRGILEVIIDENGAVVASAMRQPAHPIYDPLLLDAARRWSYYPALRGERPVKYRKTIIVTLHPER